MHLDPKVVHGLEKHTNTLACPLKKIKNKKIVYCVFFRHSIQHGLSQDAWDQHVMGKLKKRMKDDMKI